MTYPKTRTVDISDDFFGTTVPDPYRWLEDASDEEVQAWTLEQMDFALEILGTMPGREKFKRRLTEVWNYPKYTVPTKKGSRLFYTYNDGLKNQSVLYVKEGDSEPRLLLDPNQWSDGGTIALMDWQVTKDGQLLMYSTSESGLDWRTFYVLDVDTGEHLDDVIKDVKFSSAAWLPDKSGFYYSRFPIDAKDEGEDNQNVHQQLYFHKLGTPQSEDKMLYERPDLPNSSLWEQVSDDGQYLAVYVGGESFTYNRLHYARVDDHNFQPLFDDLDAAYYFIGNEGEIFYVLTTKDAPNKRLIAVDINTPDELRDIIPENDDTIANCTIINGQFVVNYMHHARNIIKRFAKDGTFLGEVELPNMGDAAFVSGNADDSEMFFPYTSYLNPPQVLRYDFESDSVDTFFDTSVDSFDADKYETKQIFYESKDGTRVPMFITAKKGLALNGDNPTILYGYGGYDISLTPQYYSWMPVWLENGGVFAVANLRGGGEYGEAWHQAGALENKQNVYDDFIAAAEWLIANQYTSSKKLAIEGRSNGGLLVAAVMAQRPDLFGAVLCHVPVIDMLRFQHFTAGRYWTSEYGDANSSEEHFDFLYKYSPLHNIKQGQKYPPLLILTADHDDRVVPMHSKKFAAKLQAADDGNNVILLRIDTKAGHGMGKPTAKVIEERVDVFAFLAGLFEMDVK
ncbi:MAG: prolyl oligopeptidase family serine peptidase [Anaerolineae bacterium]|nr:prolyl oligopeptidase family serine peptidase [Anaerolineae bacterium]